MERYSRILTIAERQFQKECSVIFEKGALLKDNKQNRNILQLQFKNIGLQKIDAVFVSIKCFDIEKQEVETIENKYLDLSVGYNECFGEKVPIILSNDSSRHFEISVIKIVFGNAIIGEYIDTMKNIPNIQSLDELGILKEQFIREVQEINSKTKCIIKPSMIDGLWFCTCGAVNSNNNYCGYCNLEKNKLFPLLDEKFLKEKNEDYLKRKEEEEKEQKRLKEQKELEYQIKKQEKQKKLGKIVIVLLIIVAIGIGSYFLSVSYIIPAMRYSSALKAIESGSYEEGYKILTELGDYKDSSEQILAGKYKQGLELISNKEYEQGCKILTELGDYSDVQEQILIAKYTEGNEVLESGDYPKAIEIFNEIADYSDSKAKRNEARFLYINEFVDKKNYYRAIEELVILKKSDRSSKVDDLLQECYIQYAEFLYEQNSYKQAIQYYQYVRDYEKVKDKMLEAKYRYCKSNQDITDNITKMYLEELKAINYKDSKSLYVELTKPSFYIVTNSSESNRTSNHERLSKYDKWCFHVKLTSGKPNEINEFKYKIIFPDGASYWGSENFKLKIGDIAGAVAWYSERAHLGTTGKCTIKIYDLNGKELASKSVEIY